MKKIVSIILTVVMLSAVVMTIPFSASAATSPVKSYNSAKPGELLYTVNFNGDSAFTPGSTGVNDAGQMDYTLVENGAGVRIKAKPGAISSQSNLWGGLIKDLPATENTIYSMVYKAKADSNLGMNNSVGVGGWAISESAFQTTAGVYNVYSNHNTKESGGSPSRDQRTALSDGVTKINGYVYVNTNTNPAIATDSDGYVTALVVYDGTTCTFSNYYLAAGATDLKDENSWIKLEERDMPKALNGTNTNYMCFWTYAFYNTIDTTIKDVRYYKEFLWSEVPPSDSTYEDADYGDLLYTFNFKGDEVFTPSRLDRNADQMDYVVSTDGSAVIIKNKDSADGSAANLWGGVVTSLPATAETAYSMVYQIKANDEIAENDTFHIGAWVVGDNEINDTDKVYSSYVYEKDAEYYEDGEGFMTVMAVYNAHPEIVLYGGTPQFSLYILADDEATWIHVETQSMADPDINGYMCFWTSASNSQTDVTIKNASIYKGNLAGTYSVEDLENMTAVLQGAVDDANADLYDLYEKTLMLEYIIAELEETDPTGAAGAIADANDVIDAAALRFEELLADVPDEIRAEILKFEQAIQSGKLDLAGDIAMFGVTCEKVVYYRTIADSLGLDVMDAVYEEVEAALVDAYFVIIENLDTAIDELLTAMAGSNLTTLDNKIENAESAIAAGEEFASIVGDTSFLGEAYAVIYAAEAYSSALKACADVRGDLDDMVDDVQEELDAAKEEIESLLDAVLLLESGLVAKDAALEQTMASLKAVLDAKVVELNQMIAALEAKAAALEAKNASLEKKNADIEAKNADLEKKNTDLEAKDAQLVANDSLIAQACVDLQITVIAVGAAVALSILGNIALAIVLIVSKKKKSKINNND